MYFIKIIKEVEQKINERNLSLFLFFNVKTSLRHTKKGV